MGNKKAVTLSIDEEIYENYRNYCEKNGLILSKKVEIFMKEELNKKRKNEGIFLF